LIDCVIDIAIIFVRPSVCLGQACIVIIRCTLAPTEVYGCIVQCSGHSDTKACLSTPVPAVFFQFHLEKRWGIDVQTRCGISRTVEDRGLVTIEC